jgi:BolA protein
LSVETRITAKLTVAFEPAALIVDNQSDQHAGPPGRETHFKVVVVSDKFAGQGLVQRHRAINSTLAEELRSGVHALAIEAFTLEQWKDRGGAIAESPPCLGGPKR